MYKIEKNIPMPRKAKKNKKYDFESMKIGDSFFIKEDDYKDRVYPNFISNLHWQARYTGVRITIRKQGDVKKGKGVRVWRIKPKKKGVV